VGFEANGAEVVAWGEAYVGSPPLALYDYPKAYFVARLTSRGARYR
jgi:hypothetical protein